MNCINTILSLTVYPFVATLVVLMVISKLWCFWCRSKVCLVGKTAIVTGGASGLGFQIALGLAAKGCRVIIADIVNISEAVEGVKQQTHNQDVIGMKVDLSSLKSTREFAEQVLKNEARLNILICNAGIASYTEKVTTEDGLDRTMQVNYFSHFLLTHLLLDLLKKSAPSRITFTGSLMAFISTINVDALNPPAKYFNRITTQLNGGVYSNSKLCMLAAAKMFGERLKGSGVLANATATGGVKTPIYWNSAILTDRNYKALALMALVFLYGKTPEEGAQTLLHLAHADVQDVTGKCWSEGMVIPSPSILTEKFCQKLWDYSVEYTKLQPQEIKLYPLVSFIAVITILSKVWCFWCRSKVCLVGKTALITGGASGLGLQSALGLAAKGCKVIIADIVKISEAVDEVKRQTHNQNIIGMKVDLASLKSVREFAKEVLAKEERLDILMCNAGIALNKEKVTTEDGLDKTMQVNYFSHFLLIHLLLDLLKKSAPSRITFSGSVMGFVSTINIDQLNPPAEYFNGLCTQLNGGVYSNSKLCMIAAAKMFGERLKDSGVTANSQIIGGVKTPIYWNSAIVQDRNYKAFALMLLVFIYGKSQEEGAQTLLHLACADDVKNITGTYWYEGMVVSGPGKLTEEFRKKLWDYSVEYTQLQPDEIKC
ncbi:uncharacterized protein LOC126741353 [Anthonomus grandis grandis]|uniref:uncharacterized protein LOC126741353 n=1 Tax=Anthonomus grandis grandis TaxID=2921223 RepID=UPI00216509C9|nr:uncharacterized protein LOC126741353 [Anthonomus grandis grandis]